MEKNELSCGAVAAIFCIAGLVGVFLWQMPATDRASGEWAAWAQVFGTIGAIIGSVYVVREGARFNARLKDEQLRRSVLAVTDALFGKVQQLKGAVEQASADTRSTFAEVYGPSVLDNYLRAVAAVPVLELPTPAAITALLELQRLSAFFIMAADELLAGPWGANSVVVRDLKEHREKVDSVEFSRKEGRASQSQVDEEEKLFSSRLAFVGKLQINNLLRVEGLMRAQVEILRAELGRSRFSNS